MPTTWGRMESEMVQGHWNKKWIFHWATEVRKWYSIDYTKAFEKVQEMSGKLDR